MGIRVCKKCNRDGFRSNWTEKIHGNKKIWCDWCQEYTPSTIDKSYLNTKKVMNLFKNNCPHNNVKFKIVDGLPNILKMEIYCSFCEKQLA